MKKKSTNHKKSTKRKVKKKSSSNKLLIFLFILLFSFFATAASYIYLEMVSKNSKKIEKIDAKKPKDKNLSNFTAKKIDEDINKRIANIDNYEEYTEELNKVHLPEEKEKKEEQSKKPKEEVKKEIVKVPKKPIVKTKKDKYVYNKKDKPKLSIVIDDVSSNKQKRDILTIKHKITMAFLPPTKRHKNSARIAQDLPFYMIHFPMQASSSFKGFEENTLNINDSYERIEKRVKQLRKWYPKAIYTNNHTGSVFTSNKKAMNNLLKALKKYNFKFVDSRTSAKSVTKELVNKYNMPYIVRNTFIDNNKDYSYIRNQLKKAIKLAKKRGYAIAIGHPHSMTIKVIRESNDLFKDVNLIYLNELPFL